MVMVDHEVKGVVEAVGKESGRCSSGGELGLRLGSFCEGRQSVRVGNTPKARCYETWDAHRTRFLSSNHLQLSS